MTIRTVQYAYHHMGIPSNMPREGERYSATFRMYTSGGSSSEFRVQYHRFDADSPLHPLIKTVPHVAFKVDDLDQAIDGKTVILGPYFPIPGFRVAMIDDNGTPIEFIQTNLSEDEIWSGEHRNTAIYPEDV